MPSSRGPVRVIVLLWAALQLALPGVAALADAFASRDGAGAIAHVEDRAGSTCVRVHDGECVFCQSLSNCASPAGTPIPEVVAAARGERIDDAVPAPILAVRRGALLPRAPPLA